MNIKEQRDVVNELQEMARGLFTSWGDLGNINARQKWWTRHDGSAVGYVILNYNGLAGRKSPWNKYEKVCRGLILEYGTGRVVAWPFEKFFNIGEFGMQPRGRLTDVSEKLDGSLGILYLDPFNEPCIATRGAFDSDHAMWATQFLQRWHGHSLKLYLPRGYTLLFEIIAPQFRNVIDYGERPRLVLLNGRDTADGRYLDWFTELGLIAEHCHFEVAGCVPVLEAGSIEEMKSRAKSLPASKEGWVITMSNGERWKIKGDEYVELHRIIHSISLKRALDAFEQGKAHAADLPSDALPEEHEDRWNYYVEMLNDVLANHFHKGRTFYEERPESSNDDRRQFAEWVFSSKDRAEYSAFLFALYDNATLGRLDQIVLKMMRRQYKNGELDWIEDDYELQNV